MIVVILNLISALSAFLAAYFWWASAAVKPPREFGVARFAKSDDPFGVTPEKQWAERLSNMNARGAMAAGVSAFCMALSTFASWYWSSN